MSQWRSRQAAERPAMPPPTITTSLMSLMTWPCPRLLTAGLTGGADGGV